MPRKMMSVPPDQHHESDEQMSKLTYKTCICGREFLSKDAHCSTRCKGIGKAQSLLRERRQNAKRPHLDSTEGTPSWNQ